MTSKLSVEEFLEDLEQQIAHHRDRAAFHTEQEGHHRERREHHTAELAKVTERHDAFKAALEAAGELVTRHRTEKSAAKPVQPVQEEALEPGRKPKVSRLVQRVIDGKAPDQAFGAAEVTAEVARRYGKLLSRPVDLRTVAAKLRRLAAAGKLHEVRPGRAHHEALYSRRAKGG